MRGLGGADDGEDGQGERGEGAAAASVLSPSTSIFFTLVLVLSAPSQVINARRGAKMDAYLLRGGNGWHQRAH